jgi:hypothetical protein
MISFGKITEQQRLEMSQLTASMAELDRVMKEIIKLQATTRYLISEWWHKVGIENNIDTNSTPYSIDMDNNIVLYDGSLK